MLRMPPSLLLRKLATCRKALPFLNSEFLFFQRISAYVFLFRRSDAVTVNQRFHFSCIKCIHAYLSFPFISCLLYTRPFSFFFRCDMFFYGKLWRFYSLYFLCLLFKSFLSFFLNKINLIQIRRQIFQKNNVQSECVMHPHRCSL